MLSTLELSFHKYFSSKDLVLPCKKFISNNSTSNFIKTSKGEHIGFLFHIGKTKFLRIFSNFACKQPKQRHKPFNEFTIVH